MLTFEDGPTIRWAILKRLDKEPGIEVLDTPMVRHPDCIRVGVLLWIGRLLVARSLFELPLEFEIGHLHNEIDQIAEQCKAARKHFWGRGRVLGRPEVQLAGTGLRGLWKQHAA